MDLVGALLTEHSRNAPLDSCMLNICLPARPFRVSELGCNQSGVRGSIPGGTSLERGWRRFRHTTEIPSCSTRGLCLKDQPKQQQQQAGRWALPQRSAPFLCPNRAVQPLLYTASVSCKIILRSLKPLEVVLVPLPLCVSLQSPPPKSFSA